MLVAAFGWAGHLCLAWPAEDLSGVDWFARLYRPPAVTAVPLQRRNLVLIYAERKIWAAVQMRRGPNVVGPWGLFQSFADLLKFVLKEPIIPAGANKGVFLLAPLVTCVLALAAWAVIPFAKGWSVADINVGVLYIFAISSLMVYGVIMEITTHSCYVGAYIKKEGGYVPLSDSCVMSGTFVNSNSFAAYLGMGFTWHAGLSASAPLLVATPKHFLEAEVGLIPLTSTIFSPFNLALTAVVVALFALLVPAIHPREGKALLVDPRSVREDAAEDDAESDASLSEERAGFRFADWIDRSPLLGWLLAAAGFIWLGRYFAVKGWTALTLNVVNFLFLMVAFALHGKPSRIVAAADGGVRLVSGVVLQFPLYAGMYGIIKGSGLAEVIGQGFVKVANAHTYPLLIYWYSGLVNYFVPSGGSKWAIEAPYVLAAGKTLGVAAPKIVMSYAWGDMMTDLIQPFWALPLLRAARLDFRHILGYAMLLCLIYAIVVSLAFGLFAR